MRILLRSANCSTSSTLDICWICHAESRPQLDSQFGLRDTSVRLIRIIASQKHLGDGKTAWEAILRRVPFIGICFTPDHAPLTRIKQVLNETPDHPFHRLNLILLRFLTWWRDWKASAGRGCSTQSLPCLNPPWLAWFPSQERKTERP
jgi:hypothetical protein